MTTYCGQDIKNLSDDDLILAIRSAADIDKNRLDRLEQAGKRHKPMFDKHPPVEGTAFTELVIALNNEFANRKIGKLKNATV